MKSKVNQHFKEDWLVLCREHSLNDQVQSIVKVMIRLVKLVMMMNGMINSDELYNLRNKTIYHCDKSAINKHINRLATVNV